MSIPGGAGSCGETPPASREPTPERRVEPARLYAYLLDVDEELAAGLDVRMRFAARQGTTARVLDAECGACDLAPWLQAVARGPGLLIIDGLLAVDTRIADRTSTELLGAGDLLAPMLLREEEMIEPHASWRALQASRLAVLDGEFLERTRPWPHIVKSLLQRAERRTEDLSLLRVIASHPRLEVRLALLLWHLGSRWGRVEPTGLRLTLPLTHRLLGQLVAAERPSVTHALSRLAGAGLISGASTDLHLQGSLGATLKELGSGHRGAARQHARAGPPRERIV